MRRRLVEVMVAALLMLAPAIGPPSGGVYLGPRVVVDVGSTNLDEGASTVVYVTVYNDSGVRVAGATVNVEAELGTFDRTSAQTGSQGVANFVYTAPLGISEARSVRINATAIYDLPPYTSGFAMVWVRTVARVGIDGPDQVRSGGPAVRYTIRATNGSSPIAGASIFVEAPALGEVVDQQRITNDAGTGWFDYRPPASQTGEVVLRVRVQPDTGPPVTGSKTIQVVAEIAQLTVSIETDRDPLPCWGSSNLTATVRRGGQPVPNATVTWLASQGWRSASSTVTDSDGRARIHYTASNSSGSLWAGPVTVSVTATYGSESARANLTFQVAPYAVGWTAELVYSSEGSQLVPGERLVVNLSLRLPPSRSWEFITPVSVRLRLWTEGGSVIHNRTVGQGLSILPGLDWSSGPIELLTIPDPPTVSRYYLQATVYSEYGGYIYHEFAGPVVIRVITQRGGWTFLHYMADDNDLRGCANRSLNRLETGGPDGQCQYLVEKSGVWGETYRYRLRRDTDERNLNLQLLATLPELDMSSPETLLDFLKWGADYAPAENYFIVIWDHGGDWRGVCWEGPLDSHIDPLELEQCLREFRSHARKPQILLFDACLMSSAEVYWRILDDVNYVVGSETVIYASSEILTPEGLRRFFSHYPPTPEQACRDVMNGFRESDHLNYPMGTVRTEMAVPFLAALNRFCDRFIENWDALGGILFQRVPLAWKVDYYAADLRSLLTQIRRDILSLPDAGRYASVVASIDDTVSAMDAMFLDRHLEGDYKQLGFGCVNIFLAIRNSTYQKLRDEYLRTTFPHDYGWVRLFELLFPPAPEESQSHDYTVWPPVRGIVHFPLVNVSLTGIGTDGESLTGNISVGIDVNNSGNSAGFSIVVDLVSLNGTLSTFPSSIVLRKVIPVAPGERGGTKKVINLTVPSDDMVLTILSLVAEDGTVFHQQELGRLMMRSTPRSGSPPGLVINASRIALLEGESVSLSAAATDPNGDRVDVWWDLDLRDGVGLDASGLSVTASFRGAWNRTVTCIASDGNWTVVRQLELSVSPDPSNRPPSAVLSFELVDASTVLFNASGSSDPDGDPLEFFFLFGDGSSWGWTSSPLATHIYEKGSYECVVMVRDRAEYGGACAAVAFNITGGPPRPGNRAPVASLSLSAVRVRAGQAVTADASGSSDPDGETLEYRFDWGDGNATDWSPSMTASHAYARPGSYNVTLSVRDAGNLTAGNTTTIFVRPAPGTGAPGKFIPGPGAAAASLAITMVTAIRARRRKLSPDATDQAPAGLYRRVWNFWLGGPANFRTNPFRIGRD